MNDLIVAANDIYKTYDTGTVEVRALRDVELNVRRGEMVAIMGPSGCGKTTLLNCFSGLDEIDSGEVLIDGVVLHDLPDDERTDYRARNMGFVFQLYNLLPVLRRRRERGDAPPVERRRLGGGQEESDGDARPG